LRDDSQLGKPLTASLAGLWSLREGDYRLFYQINDNELIVVVIKVGYNIYS
jgi:mRNA-degrading endonuclease RelE of RelBE toxin-antitoxin system